MKKVLIIGSSGFVGRHISKILSSTSCVISTSRSYSLIDEKTIYFDLQKTETWQAILDEKFDVIINSSGYGVVKDQIDLVSMYEVNYKAPLALAGYLQNAGQRPLWIQIGTAFEYDLDEEHLTEESATIPTTHYGISKLLFSNFLQSTKNNLPYILLRPFAMYGPYENKSKLFPYLINSQKCKERAFLSSGLQKRDYLYVKDLALFVEILINKHCGESTREVFNLGSGKAIAIADLAQQLSLQIPDFDSQYWVWSSVEQRSNEGENFFNGSEKALEAGLLFTPQRESFQETVKYYFNAI